MEIYEKFGKDEDLAEKERTFKNDRGDTLTVTPKNENEFTLHHVSASGKEWKEKHSRVQASNMLDRFLNKGLVEEMENEFLNEQKWDTLETSGYEYEGVHPKMGKNAHVLKDKETGKRELWVHNKYPHAGYGIKHGKLNLEFAHSLSESSDEQLDEAKDHEYYEKLKNKLHKYGRDKNYAYVSDSFKRELRNDKKYKQWKRVTDKVTHKSFSPKEKEVLHSMLGLKMAAATKAASNRPMNEEIEVEDIINELTEGVKTKYNYQGKIYNTKAFKTVKGANAFMDNNPQHGLLDVEKDEKGNEKAYHVAHIRDVGIKENSIIQNVCKRNHADAIPQFNQKIMAQVYEKMNDLFVEVAGKSFNKVDEELDESIKSYSPQDFSNGAYLTHEKDEDNRMGMHKEHGVYHIRGFKQGKHFMDTAIRHSEAMKKFSKHKKDM